MERKTCWKCKKTKPVETFYERKEVGRQSYCRDCAKEQSRQWRADNPDAKKQYNRKKKLEKYGLTVEDYERMLHAQGGRCAICKILPRSNRRLSVDHCHRTNVVRGLLCINCNRGIGNFKDDASTLQAAVNYLAT